PRITVPHMLPSATLKASASAILLLSRLDSPPRTIAVYASPWSLPSTAQNSLPGGRYTLPGPDFRRLDLASFLAHQCLSLNVTALDSGVASGASFPHAYWKATGRECRAMR